MATFTGYLRACGDDDLVTLLRLRPDLASPSPSTLSSLAARATSRASLERALAAVDAGVLQVVEAVVALGAERPVTAASVRAAVAGDDAAGARLVDAALADAQARALVHPDLPEGPDAGARTARRRSTSRDDVPLHAAPGLAELLGPYPAGLAPVEHHRADAHADTHGPEDPAEVRALLQDAPAGARQVVDALLWGPPVGLAPSNATATAGAVQWLLRRGLLVHGDSRHVVLPRRVALALRDGRTHRAPALPPTVPTDAPHRSPALVTAESVAAGEHVVRLVARLAHLWERAPAPVLRSGGLGVRELRRVATTLDIDEAEAAFVVELAGAAGLVADDGEESPSFLPTLDLDDWTALDVPARWAVLARTWLATPRTPWLVGSRDERGAVRAALDPELHRTWAPRLRRSVLGVLADADGVALTAHQVLDVLRWRAPRAVPPEPAVTAVLVEAGRLGVLGAGALSPAGRALLASADDDRTAADAFAAALPPAVDEVLLQGDLTGIVPGRPSAALEALLDATSHVESRGGALTVRFTPTTVRAALDAGATADQVLADLAAHARGVVPQPLEYLVRDAARRHGRLRAGTASSYVRADDPTLLAGLVDDPRLADLGLVALAPTVLVAQASTRELVDVLRERGLAPVTEGPDGQVLHLEPVVRRVGRRGAAAARRRASAAVAPTGPTAFREPLPDARLAALVPELRRADAEQVTDRVARTRDLPHPGGDPTAPPAASLRAAPGPAVGPGDGDGPRTPGTPGARPGTTDVETGASYARRAAAVRARGAGRADSGAGEPGGGGDVTGAGRAGAGVRGALARTGGGAAGAAGVGAVGSVGSVGGEGTADPAAALVLLREAAAERSTVWVELVGPQGVPERRLLRPVHVEGGRLRAVDPAREAELTVAVHRIASVQRADDDPPGTRFGTPGDTTAADEAKETT
ncbi:helicase-associated domain-containing protein [Cellulomonas fimi]|uniref:helicase-associated domain-containing protein n=1 Tax=Cellulomonas fimi TaxID=1708 RepID=UPI00234E2BB3|nr:helicase-associated domain-containing protein [Cellulomonas fimi]MDC7121499.1 helicase-associated domain-containing protein [Cellulomonas fimi]